MAKPTAAERVTHPAALQAQPMGIITEADMIEGLTKYEKAEMGGLAFGATWVTFGVIALLWRWLV
jgi:hypothetical protein